jgi:NAD(P)-dependent dehydrogenase (short-subunit alcohol dehydrogenase family)
MTERFAGKVALIAGGTGALGRAVSLTFLEELARVVVTYRREKEFSAVKDAASIGGVR